MEKKQYEVALNTWRSTWGKALLNLSSTALGCCFV